MASYYNRFSAFYARSFSSRPWVTLAVTNGTLSVIADSLAQSLERYQSQPSTTTTASASASASTTSLSPSTAASLEDRKWDWSRTGRFAFFGVGMAPILAEWNKFIEYRFPLRTIGGGGGGGGSAISTSASTGAQAAARGSMTAAGQSAATAGAAAAAGGSSGAAKTLSSVGKVSLLALGKRVAFDQILFAPFGLVCFVGTMGVLEYRNWEGVKGKFQDMYLPALFANWQLWPMIQLVNFRFVPLRLRVPFTSACGIAWTLWLSLLSAAKGQGEAQVTIEKEEKKKMV